MFGRVTTGRILIAGLSLFTAAFAAQAQDLARGQIIDDVKCTADATQSYALYLPSNYSKDRKWNVILAFDARGRGRVPVVQYQAAAEKYGYIVAGSNNSRNGPAQVSLKAAKAMLADIQSRFSVDPKRFYAAGQSGGARFALDLAGSTKQFAGVIASSAGFGSSAGSEISLDFALFGTAGTEDFNYLELRDLDRQVSSPHRVRIFTGEHTWLPSDLAVEALEWMEIQAMKSGIRPRDEALIDKVFNLRKARLETLNDKSESYRETAALGTDFTGLRDVTAFTDRASVMQSDKDVREAVRKVRLAEIQEGQMDAEILNLSDQLNNEAERADCLKGLRERLTKLGAQAKSPEDSPERQMARRVIRGAMADAVRADPEYRKLLDEVKP